MQQIDVGRHFKSAREGSRQITKRSLVPNRSLVGNVQVVESYALPVICEGIPYRLLLKRA